MSRVFPLHLTDAEGQIHAWNTVNNTTVCRQVAGELGVIVGGEPTCETCLLPHIICPRCGRVSFNEKDIQEGYCGACHSWTSDPIRRSDG